MGEISKPARLSDEHERVGFRCGHATLDDWPVRRALKNQQAGASRTFVVCHNNTVVGYYALATGSVERIFANGVPDPSPVIVLGRLAIDVEYQGKRLGAAMLRDAMLRTLSIANDVGVRGLLVHAISDKAKRFYQKYGFQESPIESMTLFISIKNIGLHLA